MSRFIPVVCLAAAVSVAGCASSGTSTNVASGSNTAATRSPDVITADEITTSGASSALEVVTRLRPNWMRDRGTGSMAGGNTTSQMIAVFMDGQRLGDITSLRMVSASQIKSMQWLDAARAYTVLSGLGSEPISGAIVIKTR